MTPKLLPGESLLWEGVPAQGFKFAPQDAFAVPFATVWLTGVLGISWSALSSEGHQADPVPFIILLFFILIGLYMLAGRFVIDRATRRKTRYYLTNRRAVITGGLFRSNQRSLNLAAVAEISLRQGRNGKGTIRFGSLGPFAMMPPSWPGASRFAAPAFEGIEDAGGVYDLALTAQRQAQSGT